MQSFRTKHIHILQPNCLDAVLLSFQTSTSSRGEKGVCVKEGGGWVLLRRRRAQEGASIDAQEGASIDAQEGASIDGATKPQHTPKTYLSGCGSPCVSKPEH